MKKTIAFCVLASLLALTGVGNALVPNVTRSAIPQGQQVSDEDLSSVIGGETESFWSCALVFGSAVALVIGVAILTAGAPLVFAAVTIGAGGLGVTAELAVCKS